MLSFRAGCETVCLRESLLSRNVFFNLQNYFKKSFSCYKPTRRLLNIPIIPSNYSTLSLEKMVAIKPGLDDDRSPLSSLIHPISSCPDIRLHFTLSDKEITQISSLAIQKSKDILNSIASIPNSEKTFENTVAALGKFEGDYHNLCSSLSFPQFVSTDKLIRDAAVEANKLIDDFGVEISMRKDLYESVIIVKRNLQLDASLAASLSEEDQRLMKKMIEAYERNGLLLSDLMQERLKTVKKRISSLAISFSQNINEDTTHLLFTKKELEGCTDDFFGRLEKVSTRNGVEGEYYKVTMKYPDYFGVMEFAESEVTRKSMIIAYDSRCPANVEILTEAIKLRQEIAKLLGYEDYANYVLFEKMAKNSTNVNKFLDELVLKLKVLNRSEWDVLTTLKQKTTNDPSAKLEVWDFQYYSQILEQQASVDTEFIKQYFEFNNVTKGMLDLYEKVLSLKFKEIQDDPSIWHPDVRLFEVLDDTGKGSQSKVVGHFYLDLFPRDGKYTHAACFGLQSGFLLENDQYRQPVAVMVANFTKPTKDKPSLLKHDEVITYFHELGHVMHHLCSKVKWSRFHGTNVEGDFVEAPSQMLENWCWDKETLQTLSKHYKDQSQKLPTETIEALIKSKHINVGFQYLRQIFFAKFDMTVHSKMGKEEIEWTPSSLKSFWKGLRKELTGFTELPETFGATTFGHILGGYDAGYYGYLWSLVVSADMFYSRFKKEGILNPSTGLDYRDKILMPGGSRDGNDMIMDFLGRQTIQDPFLKSIGLKQS